MPSSGQQVSESPSVAEIKSALARMFSGREGRRDSGRTTLLWLPVLTKADLVVILSFLADQAHVAQARLHLPPLSPLWSGQGGHCRSLHEVIVVFLYLVQEAMRAQSDLVLESVHNKGNMEQVISEIQKRFEAVSADPNLFPQVCF